MLLWLLLLKGVLRMLLGVLWLLLLLGNLENLEIKLDLLNHYLNHYPSQHSLGGLYQLGGLGMMLRLLQGLLLVLKGF